MQINKQETQPTRAFSNYKEMCSYARVATSRILKLGRLLYDSQKHKYYTVLGYDSWKEFLNDSDIGYAESTVRSFIRIYKLYVLKLAVPNELLAEIGHSKLQVIAPVVESDPDWWLELARKMSKNNLIKEVKGEE